MFEAKHSQLRVYRDQIQAAFLRLPECRPCLSGQPVLTGGVTLRVVFGFQRPKSHYRTGRNAHLLRDAAPEYPSSKPDIDKCLRAVGDAVTQAGVWEDDARVVCVTAMKTYCQPGEDAFTEIEIELI